MTDSELRQLGREMSTVQAGQEALRRDLAGFEARLSEAMVQRGVLINEMDKRLRDVEMARPTGPPNGEAGVMKDLRDWIILAVVLGSAIGGVGGNPIEFLKALIK